MCSEHMPKTRILCCQIATILALYRQSRSVNTTVFKPDINLILSENCNKTANNAGIPNHPQKAVDTLFYFTWQPATNRLSPTENKSMLNSFQFAFARVIEVTVLNHVSTLTFQMKL